MYGDQASPGLYYIRRGLSRDREITIIYMDA
jgi:hypothetical protein